MIEWVWPLAFLLIPLPLLIRLLWQPMEREQAALTVPSVSQFKGETETATGLGTERVPWRVIVLWLIWLLAVDISGSMGTEDLQLGGQLVNRLTVVKNVVRDFIEARQGDRVGLILFGTNAYVQAPLTFDLPTVNQLLTEAPVGIAGGKTAIGDAIGLAVKRLRQRPAGEKVLILLTDGANNVGEVAPIKAAELAGQEAIRIYTIGVGADEMRLPSIFGSFGSRVVNPSAELDEETLTAIANTTGGQYYRAQNTAKLIEIYAVIDELEPIEQEAETYRPIAALYHWPLAGGWILFMLLLVADWRGWGGD
jgi:Ca-activated chloride channel family protein